MKTKTRVLICGATGFIGRNLVESLGQRDDLEVHAVRFTRPAYTCAGVTWHQGDLRDEVTVHRLVDGMDVVIQAAATTSGAKDIVTRPHIHVTDNAVMNSLLLRACYERKVEHFIFLSCSVMYQARETPWREEEWDLSQDLHSKYFGAGWTKIYIEKMCEFFSRLGTTRYTVIRHTNVYGPHDKFDLERSHMFGATVTKVMTSQTGTVTVWGTGEEARDFIYVSDLVRFVERCMERQQAPYCVLHASSGTAVSVKDVVASIIAASGRNLRIVYDPTAPTINTSFSLDSSRAEELFGWKPEVSFEEGVQRTVDWWLENHSGICSVR